MKREIAIRVAFLAIGIFWGVMTGVPFYAALVWVFVGVSFSALVTRLADWQNEWQTNNSKPNT